MAIEHQLRNIQMDANQIRSDIQDKIGEVNGQIEKSCEIQGERGIEQIGQKFKIEFTKIFDNLAL